MIKKTNKNKLNGSATLLADAIRGVVGEALDLHAERNETMIKAEILSVRNDIQEVEKRQMVEISSVRDDIQAVGNKVKNL